MSETERKTAQSLLDFTGEVVWVTGSASGIGRRTALLFAECGADVVVHGLNQRPASDALAQEIAGLGRQALVLDGDLTVATTVAAMGQAIADRFGKLNVLVNCAGGEPARRAPLQEVTLEEWNAVIARNLTSMFLASKAAIPLLQAAIATGGTGRIVNVSSATERTGGIPGSVAYTAAKGGVNAMTRGLAKELAGAGIRVNAASPGLIDTPFHSADARRAYPDLIARIPLGRLGLPFDLAGPILFLASDLAGYMTGEVIEASGGSRLR